MHDTQKIAELASIASLVAVAISLATLAIVVLA